MMESEGHTSFCPIINRTAFFAVSRPLRALYGYTIEQKISNTSIPSIHPSIEEVTKERLFEIQKNDTHPPPGSAPILRPTSTTMAHASYLLYHYINTAQTNQFSYPLPLNLFQPISWL
jgi:hypothetical protein